MYDHSDRPKTLLVGRRGIRQEGDHPRVRHHWPKYNLLHNARFVDSL